MGFLVVDTATQHAVRWEMPTLLLTYKILNAEIINFHRSLVPLVLQITME